MRHQAPTTARDEQLASSSPFSSPPNLANTNVLLVCDHSLEGVLQAIGLAYLWHLPEDNVRMCSDVAAQPMFGEQVVTCPDCHSSESIALARRVHKGLEKVVSAGCSRLRNGSCPSSCDAACVNKLAYACAADDSRMPEIVHRYARMAFSVGAQIRTLESCERVAALNELARYTLGECERVRQFARFQKLCDGSFVCVFHPKANAIPLMSRHFADRMRADRFCMVDPDHLVAAFHDYGQRTCSIVRVDTTLAKQLYNGKELAKDEAYVQAMWKHFYQALELSGRDASQRGYDLRSKWVPKRFWADLPELRP